MQRVGDAPPTRAAWSPVSGHGPSRRPPRLEWPVHAGCPSKTRCFRARPGASMCTTRHDGGAGLTRGARSHQHGAASWGLATRGIGSRVAVRMTELLTSAPSVAPSPSNSRPLLFPLARWCARVPPTPQPDPHRLADQDCDDGEEEEREGRCHWHQRAVEERMRDDECEQGVVEALEVLPARGSELA